MLCCTIKHHKEGFALRGDGGSNRSSGIPLAFLKFVLRSEFTRFGTPQNPGQGKTDFNITACKRGKIERKQSSGFRGVACMLTKFYDILIKVILEEQILDLRKLK